MNRQQIEALFAHWARGLNQHDASALSMLYAPNAVVESPMAGGEVKGRNAIGEVTRAWLSGFPDVTFTLEALLIDGDRAAWIGVTHGTDTGGFMGLPPTNKPFRVPMVFLCTVADGVIIHERRIYDFTGMLVQIGLLKARPA